MLFVWILLNLIVVTSTNDNWHQLDGIEYYIEYTAVQGVDKAKEGCNAINATLAVVKTWKIQQLLMGNIDNTKLTARPYAFYIGLRRPSKTTLQWSDGTTTDTSVFTYWDIPDLFYNRWVSGEISRTEVCVVMGRTDRINGFKWRSRDCGDRYRFICQRNITTTTTPEPSTTERSFTSEKTATTTNMLDHVTIGDVSHRSMCKTPPWVIPLIVVLSSTVVISLSLLLYTCKRLNLLRPEAKPPGAGEVNMDTTEVASGHIIPYATTSSYQPPYYENLKAPEPAYEDLNNE